MGVSDIIWSSGPSIAPSKEIQLIEVGLSDCLCHGQFIQPSLPHLVQQCRQCTEVFLRASLYSVMTLATFPDFAILYQLYLYFVSFTCCRKKNPHVHLGSSSLLLTFLLQVAKSIKIVMASRSASIDIVLDMETIQASFLCIDAYIVKESILQTPRMKLKEHVRYMLNQASI